MMGLGPTFLSGLALGFSGSLHCACMCGCIASGSLFILNPNNPLERLTMLLKLQAGRIFCYTIAGGIIAGIATLTINPVATSGTFRAAQWASTAVLMWMGLSMAGLVPSVALPIGLSNLPASVDHLMAPIRRQPKAMPYALGITWGMTPCPMVYAALFSAALTGSTAGGVAWMAGFGLGTVPAVVAAALGMSSLSRIRSSRAAQTAAGLAIAAFAGLTVLWTGPTLTLLCSPR
jgi:uncharacterized protein